MSKRGTEWTSMAVEIRNIDETPPDRHHNRLSDETPCP
jgi:hypothetical protein